MATKRVLNVWYDRNGYSFKFTRNNNIVTCIILRDKYHNHAIFSKLKKEISCIETAQNSMDISLLITKYALWDYCVATATCAENDEFDLEKGMNLSFDRAYKLYKDTILSDLNNLNNLLDRYKQLVNNDIKRVKNRKTPSL